MALKPLRVTATFVGKPGSMGFLRNCSYNLTINGDTIWDVDGRRCPYGSVAAFLRNWTNIKHEV